MSMSGLTPSTTLTDQPGDAAGHRSSVLWRVAGGLALGHVVLLLGAFALEGTAATTLETPATEVARTFAGLPLPRTFGAGYLEALSFFVLVPAVVVLGLLFARRSVTGRIAAGSFVAFGVSYVASTLAVGFPPGAAALYGAQHGAAPLDLAMVNDIRNFGFYLQVALSAAMALCLGLAAVAERTHTRWIGWGGIALGAGGIVAVPFAHNAVSMLFLLWWAGLGVIALRARSSQPGRIPQD